jgi:hypothetical protein
MSRFLHRPMFRRGGSAGEGITSGLRPGYNRGRVVNPGGYAGEEYSIFKQKDLESLYPGLYGESEYELYIKEDGTIGKRKKEKLTKENVLEKSIMDFAPEKVERKEPTSLGSGLPGGREVEVEEDEITSLGSGLPGGREEEIQVKDDEITSLGSGLPGGRGEEIQVKEDEEGPSGTLDQLMLGEAPKLPKSTAGADFWLNLGTNILAQPGGRPILQTLGTAGREPLARYQQQRGQENLLKYKHDQAERAFNLEIYKAMTDKDKHALQEKIDYLVEEHGLTPEQALNRALPEFRKSMSKEDEARQALEYERDELAKDVATIQSGLSKEGSYVSKEQAKKIYDFYQQADSQGWKYEADAPFIDENSIAAAWRELGKTEDQWRSPEGNIAIPADEQQTYDEGLYYVDSFTGDVYQVGPGSTELIKIDLSEIKI